MRIAGASVNQIPLAWEHNTNNIISAIEDAKAQQIKLLCLPELCITGYGCEDLFLSDWLDKKALAQLPKIVEQSQNIALSVGLPIQIEGKQYNCICFIENGEIKGFTAKQFMAIDGVHYEFRWFTPWPRHQVIQFEFQGKSYPFGDVTYEVGGKKIGFEICEDSWRGEARPGYELQKRGMDIIMNPSASHFAIGKSLLREELMNWSSQKFDCTFIYANLLGNEAGRMIYDGEIMITQKGKLISKNELLSFKNHNISFADIDFDNPENSKGKISPIKSKNEEFIAATTLALYDYLRKSKSKGFVISLSGGADSATCAVLVTEMIRRGVEELGLNTFLKKMGREDILTENPQLNTFSITSHLLDLAYQSTDNSSYSTFEAAKRLAESIGAKFHNWSIQSELESMNSTMEKVLGRKLTWQQDDIALQNIQARLRSPLIWMLTNIKGSLLITTSNRSEGDVGYTTMDGDSSGSIAPISGVDKSFVREWLIWAEKSLGYSGLEMVNSLNPTAELRPQSLSQSDEADLMPYNLLVEIERHAILARRSPIEVLEILDLELDYDRHYLKQSVKKFFQLWSRSQWKRERTAPSFHLDDFNIDPKTWCRFPILSSGFEQELKELENA
ncbi:NAD(+) synthase [Peijinzhouia sedimentorum]